MRTVVLGVRNNTAYARWWEARTLWGAVVNQSRNLARSLVILMPASGDRIAWAHAVRCGLRRPDP